MKVIAILFLLDIILALDFINSSCSSETCLSNLKTYVEKFKYHIICEKNKGRLICRIPLHKPSVEEISGLSIVAYAINQATGEKHPIQDVYREDNDENAFFVVSLTTEEIKNSKACKKIKDETDYFKRQCEIVWEYISTPSSSLLMKQTYTLGIEGTSRSGGFVIDFPVIVEPKVEEGCSCVIDVTLKNRKAMYLGMNCDQPLNPGSVLTFGDYICLAVFGDDPISENSYLEVDKIVANYMDNEGRVRPIEISETVTKKCSLTSSCEHGEAYAIFPISYVGTLRFSVIVTLHNTPRLLQSTNFKRGMRGDFENDIVVQCPPGVEPPLRPNFGSAMGVSLLSLVLMLVFIM